MKPVLVYAYPDSISSLQEVLEECNYKVTLCEDSDQLPSMIWKDQTKFELVIIEVSVTSVDRYELCRLVREYTDTPILAISSACSFEETAEKALNHGASYFLLKPIKVEDLRELNLDVTHVKQECSAVDQEQEQGSSSIDTIATHDGSLRKRKKELVVATIEQPARKRQRVVWGRELHDLFVKAVNQFGLYKADPQQIMEVMDVPGLTCERVASYLQKYFQYRKKQQREIQEKKHRQLQEQKQQKQQKQQHCKQFIVKAEQDVNQKLMLVPSSSISHQVEANSEQQVLATNVGSDQVVPNWPQSSVEEVGFLLQKSSLEPESSRGRISWCARDH